MAAQVEHEGTANIGEKNANSCEQFLLEHDIPKDTIQKLAVNGLNTINLLREIGMDDINDICKECGIKTLQKVKLKAAIKALQPQHDLPPVMIDKEERLALTKMAKKVKTIEESITLVDGTTKTIDESVRKHTNTIKSTFKEIHQLLDQREAKVIEKLNKIANEKKVKLKIASNTLNQQHIGSKQKLKECSSKVSKPTQLHEIETRIEAICNIAKEVDDIKIITKEDPIISNNKINISLNKTLINKTINSFGDVSGVSVPVLVSVTDNKNRTVSVKWKLMENDLLQNKSKLKIEWSETKSDDIDQFDEKWQYNKQIDLNNNNNKSIDVDIENKTAIYLFRIQYFDGKNWSETSNIKSVSIKQKVTDKWDPNCKHNELQISGNSIVNTLGNQRSAYLSQIVSEGIHLWKIKIDKTTSGWQLFGIWKTEYDPIIDSYFESSCNQSYAFAMNDGYLLKPEQKGQRGRKYGVVCKAGDIIEMTLNLINCSLSYTINGTDYGKAFDVEKTSYKAAVTLRYKDTKFTLLSYRYRSQ